MGAEFAVGGARAAPFIAFARCRRIDERIDGGDEQEFRGLLGINR